MIIIDHTEIPDALRGRSVGQALVRRAVEDARAQGRFIVPLCPFAKAQIERHPEWQDVLKRSRTLGTDRPRWNWIGFVAVP